MLFIPIRGVRLWGGIIQILFQGTLIISGNLSFLNWLTILPAICCLDDKFLSAIFSSRDVQQAATLSQAYSARLKLFWASLRQSGVPFRFVISSAGSVIRLALRKVLHLAVLGLIVYHSIPIVKNLMASRQIMNTSFDPWRIVNTYGAFGSITKVRHEVTVFGAASSNPRDDDWEEYVFKVKPGPIARRPPWISPYHYRLDWLMWFAGFGTARGHPWLLHLLVRLLLNDDHIVSLIRFNPFKGRDPPKWIKADLYEYTYTKLNSSEANEGKWWSRKYVEPYVAPTNLNSSWLHRVMEMTGWDDHCPKWREVAKKR